MHEIKNLLNILDKISKSYNDTVRTKTTVAKELVVKWRQYLDGKKKDILIIRMNIESKSKQKKKVKAFCINML